VGAADVARAGLCAALANTFSGGGWLLWPTTVGSAPPRGLSDAATDAHTGRALVLGALASLTGACQVTVPVADIQSRPFGLSVIAPPGHDRALLRAIVDAAASLPPRAREERPS
jgi:Asp-tRNA(Asn)/Glu-tRNA(Gln) amidotransferase A subunit family amidase